MDILKRFFGAIPENPAPEQREAARDVRVASCALFIEMANIDDEFTTAERDYVISLLQRQYGLSSEHAEELVTVAHSQLQGSIDLWRFTNLINQNYSKEEKLEVVEMIWRIVYEDGHLSAHENYLMHKLATMLRVTHRELMQAKLNVLHGE